MVVMVVESGARSLTVQGDFRTAGTEPGWNTLLFSPMNPAAIQREERSSRNRNPKFVVAANSTHDKNPSTEWAIYKVKEEDEEEGKSTEQKTDVQCRKVVRAATGKGDSSSCCETVRSKED